MSLVNTALYPEHVCLTVKTESEWLTLNPILMTGEVAVCTQCADHERLDSFDGARPVYVGDSVSTRVRLKAGDGVTRWENLPYTDTLTDNTLRKLTAITAQKIYDLDTRLKAAEALISQYEDLALSMLLHLNSLTHKLEQEEGIY